MILPGRVALVKWALAEGCPRQSYTNMNYTNMARAPLAPCFFTLRTTLQPVQLETQIDAT